MVPEASPGLRLNCMLAPAPALLETLRHLVLNAQKDVLPFLAAEMQNPPHLLWAVVRMRTGLLRSASLVSPNC